MINNITRKAILIGCPGSGKNYLHGVGQDLQNIHGFLCSDKGGRWFNNEITILANATPERTLTLIHSTIADYVFIYFSGHGYTSHINKRMLMFGTKPIPDLYFLNKSPRQLIVMQGIC